jgi:hypothetical protein
LLHDDTRQHQEDHKPAEVRPHVPGLCTYVSKGVRFDFLLQITSMEMN